MVGQDSGELGFVFQQRIQIGLGHFRKRGVGRRKHGERTRALERVDQTGGLQRRGQSGEVACIDSGINDVLGLH